MSILLRETVSDNQVGLLKGQIDNLESKPFNLVMMSQIYANTCVYVKSAKGHGKIYDEYLSLKNRLDDIRRRAFLHEQNIKAAVPFWKTEEVESDKSWQDITIEARVNQLAAKIEELQANIYSDKISLSDAKGLTVLYRKQATNLWNQVQASAQTDHEKYHLKETLARYVLLNCLTEDSIRKREHKIQNAKPQIASSQTSQVYQKAAVSRGNSRIISRPESKLRPINEG